VLFEVDTERTQVEPGGDVRVRAEHLLPEPLFERPPNPIADRGGEAPLGEFQELAGEAGARQLPEQVLAFEPRQLGRGRNAKRELHHAAIQQRAANFQTVMHAHPVHFHQRRIGKIDLEIGILSPL